MREIEVFMFPDENGLQIQIQMEKVKFLTVQIWTFRPLIIPASLAEISEKLKEKMRFSCFDDHGNNNKKKKKKKKLKIVKQYSSHRFSAGAIIIHSQVTLVYGVRRK